jgi:hypothetical protein
MKNIFTTIIIICIGLSSFAQDEIGAPYNPDSNSDSLINVTDLLQIFPLFGQPFLPSDDDLDNENEIQSLYISNDTLYLIPNGGFILLGDLAPDFNYDSLATTLSMDSTFLANVGGIGSGGCSYAFPDGLDGDNVVIDLQEGEYFVPTGKNLYIFSAYRPNGLPSITVDGLKVFQVDGSPIQSWFTHGGSYLVKSGSAISFVDAENENGPSLSGLLVDSQVEPVVIDLLGGGNYTVPNGKVFHLTTALREPFNGSLPSIGVNGKTLFKAGNVGYASNWTTGSFPFAKGGDVISITDSESIEGLTLSGYLVDEDYFADCGGGGAPSNPTSNYELHCIDMGVGEGCWPVNEEQWVLNEGYVKNLRDACYLPVLGFEAVSPTWRRFRLSGPNIDADTKFALVYDQFNQNNNVGGWFEEKFEPLSGAFHIDGGVEFYAATMASYLSDVQGLLGPSDGISGENLISWYGATNVSGRRQNFKIYLDSGFGWFDTNVRFTINQSYYGP